MNAAKLHETALHHAAKVKNVDLIEMLVQFGGDIYARDNRGRKPSDYARSSSAPARCLEHYESECRPRRARLRDRRAQPAGPPSTCSPRASGDKGQTLGPRPDLSSGDLNEFKNDAGLQTPIYLGGGGAYLAQNFASQNPLRI